MTSYIDIPQKWICVVKEDREISPILKIIRYICRIHLDIPQGKIEIIHYCNHPSLQATANVSIISTKHWIKLIIRRLTLKWSRYFYSCWCPRGFPCPPKKTTFQLEFYNEICTIYERTIKNHNSRKKIKCCTVSKWRPNNHFLRRRFDFGQNLKNHFPKRIFQWNLAQSRRTWIDLHYWYNV